MHFKVWLICFFFSWTVLRSLVNPVLAMCSLITSWMGQHCLTCNSLPHWLSSVYNMPLFWKVNCYKFADNKHASLGNLWWTGLHDSHNTSQKQFVLYLLNVHLYICILSCNMFWRASTVVCIFINEAFCDFMHQALERSIKLVFMPAVQSIYELKCSALYK